MNNNILIPLDEAKKDWFTEDEIKELDKQIAQRMELKKLQQLRKRYNLTQKQLSKKSGIPRSTISKIENGKRNVSFDKLIKVANALNKDLVIKFVDRK